MYFRGVPSGAVLCLSLLLAAATQLSAERLETLLPREQRLFPPDDGAEGADAFGTSVAMDGQWAVVGAPFDDVGSHEDAGAVYALNKPGGSWNFTQKVTSPKAVDAPSFFGAAVAIRGDLMIVGAPGKVQGVLGEIGRVYVYQLTGGQWEYQREIQDPDAQPSGEFGVAVAFDQNLLLVGAANAEGRGRAFFFESPAATGWQLKQPLTKPSLALGTRFGAAVALADGVALVGCPGPQNASPGGPPGKVFEYRLNAGQWTETRVIVHPIPTSSDQFGSALALAGGRALIGAPNGVFAANATPAGTAHIYNIAPSGWTLQRSLDISGFSGNSGFGSSVALTSQRALMASRSSDNSGVVMQLRMTDQVPNTWSFTAVPGSGFPELAFGRAVALQGESALVGVPQTGSHSVVSLAASNGLLAPTQVIRPTLSRHQQYGRFGEAIAISRAGTLAVVGDPLYDSADHEDVGCAYILERRAGQWQIVQVLDSPLQEDFALFGFDVEVEDDRVVVLAPEKEPVVGKGAAFGYQPSAGSWPAVPTWTLVPNEQERFGRHMALSESRLAVMAGDPTAVFMYELGVGSVYRSFTTAWSSPPSLAAAGTILAMQGNTLALMRKPAPPGPVSDIAIFDVGPQSLTRRAVLLPPGVGFNAELPFGAFLSLDGDLLAASDDANLWLETYQRGSKGWRKLDPVPKPADWSPSDLHCESLAVREGVLLVGTERDARIYHRAGNGWQLSRVLFDGDVPNEPRGYGHQVALSTDSAMISAVDTSDTPPLDYVFTPASVSFVPLADAALADGPPAPSLQVSSGGALDLGELAAGVTTTIPLTIINRGARPLQLTGATVTWITGLTSFNTATVPQQAVPAGNAAAVSLAILPPSAGVYAVTLRIHNDDVLLGDLVFEIRHTAVTTPHLPPQVLPFGPMLEKVGNPIVLNPEIRGTRIYTCQWLKDGKLLPGQTQRALFIPSSKPPDAGLYRLQLTWFGGEVTSADISVGLYEELRGNLDLRPDQHFKLAARVWGPGVKVEWEVAAETAFVRGTRTPTLDVVRADAVPISLQASAVLGGVIKPFVSFVVHLRAPPILAVSALPSVLTKGEAVSTQAVLDVSLADVTPSFGAAGLPPGLSLDATTGELNGAPTRSGIYTIRFTARNAYGVATPLVWQIRVVDAPETDFGQPGMFAGLISMPSVKAGIQEAALFRSGLITARVEMTGAISGQVRIGRERRSFAGKLTAPSPLSDTRSKEFVLAPLNGSRTTLLRLSQSSELIGSLLLTYGAATEIELPLQLDPVMPEVALRPVVLSGQYNVLLPMPANDPVVPQGTGFMSLKLGSGNSATAAGTLPNGAGFTASLPLVRSLSLGVSLLLAANNPEGDAVSARILWFDLGAGVEPDLYSEFHWSHAARPGSRLHPDPVPDISLNIVGNRYFPPAPGNRILPQLERGADLAMLILAGGGIENSSAVGSLLQVVNITSQNKAVVPAWAGNPLKMRLDFFAPTGFFSGSFTVDDPVPDSTRQIKRVVGFRGMILPSRNEGGGLFFLPQLPDPFTTPPTTINNSPILSGSVSLSIPSVGP